MATVSVKLLDEEYPLSCAEDEVDDLTASAQALDERMRAIRAAGKVFGVERIAVLAALNIAHDKLLRDRQAEAAAVAVRSLAERARSALERAAGAA